jgi:hypothetical protein
MTVSDAGSRIARTPERVMPEETVVKRRAARVDGLPSPFGSGSAAMSSSVLAHQLAGRLAALSGCRVDVARMLDVAWTEVPAGRLTLQWTILPTGAVAYAEVIAIDPTDLHVLECVKRRMTQWSFAVPRDGAIDLSSPFAFRWPSRAAAAGPLNVAAPKGSPDPAGTRVAAEPARTDLAMIAAP